MKQTDPQYKLRLPLDLKEQVEKAADEAGRSMNAEIVTRLQASFEAPSPALPPAIQSQLSRAADAKGISVEQALHEAILAGLAPDAAPVLFFHVHADATVGALAAVFDVVKKKAGPKARFTMQQD